MKSETIELAKASQINEDELKELVQTIYEDLVKDVDLIQLKPEEREEYLSQAQVQAHYHAHEQVAAMHHTIEEEQRQSIRSSLGGQNIPQPQSYLVDDLVHNQMNYISNVESDFEGENDEDDELGGMFELHFQQQEEIKQGGLESDTRFNRVSTLSNSKRKSMSTGHNETVGSFLMKKNMQSSNQKPTIGGKTLGGMIRNSNSKKQGQQNLFQQSERQERGKRGKYNIDGTDFLETRAPAMIEYVVEEMRRESLNKVPDFTNDSGQYYMPPFDDCTIDFLADALAEKKILLHNSEVKIISVPKLHEFSVKQLQQLAFQDQTLSKYLPTNNPNRPLNREFLFNVQMFFFEPPQIINTVKPEFFPDSIRESMKRRLDKAAEKDNKVVFIAPKFQELINKTMTQSKNNRGRAIHLLSAGATRVKKRKRPDEREREMYKITSFKRMKGNEMSMHHQSNTNEMIPIKNFKPNLRMDGSSSNNTAVSILNDKAS